MPHIVLLGAQIGFVFGFGCNYKGNAVYEFDGRIFKCINFVGVVGEQVDAAYAQRFQHINSDIVVARIDFEAQVQVGVNGIEAHILEVIGFQFIDNADASAFLAQVQQDAVFFGDHFQGAFELFAAVAALGAKQVAGDALRVDAGKHRLAEVARFMHERQVRHPVIGIMRKGYHVKFAPEGRYDGVRLLFQLMICCILPN